MSLKSRIQKNRRSKSSSETYTDLLDFFKENKEIDSLYIYPNSKIYEEKNGITKKSSFEFSSQAEYVNEIQRIAELYGNTPSYSAPEVKIDISDELFMKIFVQPVVSEGIYTILSRVKPLSDFSNLIISNEINLYLKECLKQRVNIFVEGSADVNKKIVLEYLFNHLNKNEKIVISDKNNEIKINNPCCLKIGNLQKNIRKIPFDYIIVNDTDTQELIKIFELIIGGYKGFTVSLSLKNNADILASIRNILLLSSPNLFEENADFMSVSSVDVIISVENDNDGNIIISKISEIFESSKGYSVKDIFVFDELNSHISTGNRSKFFKQTNSAFSSEYFKENYIHSYSEKNEEDENIPKNIEKTENAIVSEEETNDTEFVKTNFEEIFETKDLSTQLNEDKAVEKVNLSTVLNKSDEIIDIKEQENTDFNNEIGTVIDNTEQKTVSEIVEPLSKKEKLKKKLKENKKKKTSKTEIFEASEENDVSPVIQTQSAKPTEENIIIEDFESENKEAVKNEFTVKNNKKPYIEIFEETEDSSNEGALASETDDFQMEHDITPSKNKVTNILDDYDNYSEKNDIITEISDEYSQYYEEEQKTVKEPELFSEIKDVDVNSTPDDIFEIEDENI